ncbi:MAG: MFS transporter [Magnetovibrio sp.]|nr:MFS transporter [Magnetovibrio sp.]
MTDTARSTPPNMTLKIGLKVFLPFAFGYFLSYLFRVVNAVIAPDLTADLGLGAGTLGLLTAAYFLTFAAFQLPLGILLDRYGPRRVEAVLLIFAAIGAALFAWADSVQSLIIARALIGFGVSACLMASFKAYVMWFPLDKLPLVNGFQLAAGGLGAMTATAPVEMALSYTDWRGIFWILSGVTIAAAALIFSTVPERDAGNQNARFKQDFSGVIHVFQSPIFWRIAPLTVLSQSAFLALQTLWVGPWMMDVLALGRHQAALNLFWISASMIAGFLGWGILSERVHKIFDIGPMTISAVAMGLCSVSLLVLSLGLADQYPTLALGTWMMFSFCGAGGVLSYAALSQAFPHNMAGRVNTALNLLVFVMAFTSQWLVGAVLDLWPTRGAGIYDVAGYHTAFLILFGAQVLGLGWFLVRRSVRV